MSDWLCSGVMSSHLLRGPWLTVDRSRMNAPVLKRFQSRVENSGGDSERGNGFISADHCVWGWHHLSHPCQIQYLYTLTAVSQMPKESINGGLYLRMPAGTFPWGEFAGAIFPHPSLVPPPPSIPTFLCSFRCTGFHQACLPLQKAKWHQAHDTKGQAKRGGYSKINE